MTILVASEETVIRRTGIIDHQPGRIGVADKIGDIDAAIAQQFVDQRENE